MGTYTDRGVLRGDRDLLKGMGEEEEGGGEGVRLRGNEANRNTRLPRFVVKSRIRPLHPRFIFMSEREDIEREEFLDNQDPLRHLRSPDADDMLVPAQPPSILNQRTDLIIPGLNPGDPGITVKLALDASPGCGGIAWPAGEARNFALSNQGIRGSLSY